MDPNTTNFDELTHHWSFSDNIYNTVFQLDNTTPNTIFHLSFSNDSNKFFSDLINLPTTQYSISPWNEKSNKSKSEYINIKQRNLHLNPTKNATTHITQTAFFKPDLIIIYSISQLQKQNKKCDYKVICRWTIKTHSKDVYISIHVNILCNIHTSRKLAVIKSKWLTFYRSHFDTWKRLITEYINCQFIGKWNKLYCYKTMNITMDNIEYLNGAKINIKINTKTNEIIAYYSPKQFIGKLIEIIEKNRKYQFIEWSNNTIWIKNGFAQFEGKYKNNENQIYVINNSGLITMPITGMQIQFQLSKYNQIQYISNGIIHEGILCEKTLDIKWENGTIWSKEGNKDVVESVHNESEEKSNIMLKNEKPDENGIEIDNFESIEDVEQDATNMALNDVEQDVTAYRDENINLEIKDDHFVLVNERKLHNDEVDEWLLV